MKPFFNNAGLLLIGKHKGRHYTKIDPGWLDWATGQIEGFATQLSNLRAGLPPIPSKPSKKQLQRELPIKSTNTNRRTYILRERYAYRPPDDYTPDSGG